MMIRKTKIIQDGFLALCLLLGLSSTAFAEYRCGWLDNPEPGSYQLIDKEAVWTISKNDGYRIPAASLKNLPQRQENQFIRTNGNFGYSCSCVSVKTEARSRRITSIDFKGKQVLLKRCLEDKTIAHRQPTMVRKLPGLSINNPSGSYTDTPVISAATDSKVAKPAVKRVSVKNKRGTHFIQVMVTSMPAKAKRMKSRFDKAGFKTIISGIKSKGKVLQKVRIGPYPSRRAAANAQIKLRKSFKEKLGVNKSIIVG
jgi:hypothetical protein